MLTREEIAARAAREIQNGESVHLDPSWADLLRSKLPAGVQLAEPAGLEDTVDVAIVGATTVTRLGQLGGTSYTGSARKLVALIEKHQGDDGAQHVLKDEEPAALTAQRVITDLAVFDVTPEGLVMREVAPGVSALDVQKKSEANLLAADDLHVIPV